MAAYYNDFLKRGSSKIIFVGAMYMFFGVLAAVMASAVTVAAVVSLGVVLIAVGATEIIYGYQGRHDGQLWPHLGFGVLALSCGGLMFFNPLTNIMGFTLIASFLLIATGLSKLVGSVAERNSGWQWYAVNGVVSMVLGTLVLFEFPLSAWWFVGTLIGADLFLTGCAHIGLGYAIKTARRNIVDQSFSTLHPEPRYRPDRVNDHHSFH